MDAHLSSSLAHPRFTASRPRQLLAFRLAEKHLRAAPVTFCYQNCDQIVDRLVDREAGASWSLGAFREKSGAISASSAPWAACWASRNA
jgi:hypothetical protein